MSNLFRHFAGAGLILSCVGTVGLVFAGLLGTVYTSQISSSFPFSLFKDELSQSNAEAMFFWIVFVFAAVIFFVGYYFSQTDDVKLKKDILEAAETAKRKIAEVQILPSKIFLEDIEFNNQNLFKVLKEFYSSQVKLDQQSIERLINEILHSILALVSAYEEDLYGEQGAVYGANIMTFNDAYKSNADQASDVRQRIMFIDEATDITSLRGVLEMQTSLSANSEYKTTKLDPDLQNLNFCLPVPQTAFVDDRYVALPGAPVAYLVADSINRHEDTLDLESWMEQKGDYLISVRKKVGRYFSSEQHNIRSFMSVQVVSEDGKISVLNIHKNRPGLLHNNEQLNYFVQLLFPYRETLGVLIKAWQASKA